MSKLQNKEEPGCLDPGRSIASLSFLIGPRNHKFQKARAKAVHGILFTDQVVWLTVSKC